MTEDEKIQLLREELKNGRIVETSSNPDSNSGSDDRSFGTAFSSTGRANDTAKSNGNIAKGSSLKSGDNQQSSDEIIVRKRQPNRRSSEDNGRSVEHSAETNSIGRLVADGPIQPRFVTPEQPNKQSKRDKILKKYPTVASIFMTTPDISAEQLAAKLGVTNVTASNIKKIWTENKNDEPIIKPNKSSFFSKGKVFSEKEAKEIAEPLIDAINSDCEYLDQFLQMRLRSVGRDNEPPIWSDIDEDEVKALSHILTRWSMRSGVVANVTRGIVESADYIAVGAIFAPRINRTVKIMRETRLPRKKRGSHENNH